MDRAQRIVDRARDLPSLPTVAHKILELLRDPGTSTKDLEEIASRDQALASKILRMANSALYALRQPASTLRRAIVVLGFNTLRSTVMAAATQSLYQSGSPRLQDMLLWEHALAAAVAARCIAQEIKYAVHEEIFVAGLLHDIGKVVLDKNLGDEYQEVIERVYNEGSTFLEAETDILGFDHTDVGALLVKKWNLPPRLQEAVRLHHRPMEADVDPTFCAVVSLANSQCVKLGIGPEHRPDLELGALEATLMLPLDEHRLSIISEKSQEELAEERAVFIAA